MAQPPQQPPLRNPPAPPPAPAKSPVRADPEVNPLSGAVDTRPVAVTADTSRNPMLQACFNLPQGATGVTSLNTTEARLLAAVSPQSFSAMKPLFQGAGHVSSSVATPTTGAVLTANPGAVLAKPAATLSYQWTRDGANIASATAATYTVVAGDLTKNIACTVTATNASGAAVSLLKGMVPL